MKQRLTRVPGVVTAVASLLSILVAPPVLSSAQGAEESNTSSSAETTGSSDRSEQYEKTLQAANDLYGSQKFKKALAKYVDASQLKPTDAFPYLGIARSSFWLDRYGAAVFHYDLFLQAAQQTSNPRARVADAIEPARAERKTASTKSDGEAWQRPEAQRRLLSALKDQLDTGSAYTAGGGGAWALYEALMRTDFVDPSLARIRRQLARKLLEEVNQRLMPRSDELVPRRSLSDWEEDENRLEAAASLTVSDTLQKQIDSRRTVVAAGIAMLNGNHADAARQFAEATESIEQWQFPRWFRIACLIRAGDYDTAEDAIRRARNEPFITSRIQEYLDLMQALIAQREGRNDRAAEIFNRLLSGSSNEDDGSS